MKAMIFTAYGSPDLLQLKEVEKPVPADDQVLVRIHAASVNYGDVHFVRGEPLPVRFVTGFPKPKPTILGWDLAGRVEAIGRNAMQFQPGDEVFGDLSHGTFAEYACAREDQLVLKPANISFEQAAAAPVAALTALQGLRDHGGIRPGQKVLIHGASGGVGTFAVQVARSFGADVTAVCSPRNVDMVRSLGADHVLDYTKEDFARNGQRYDLIMAANGNRSIFAYLRALAPAGTFVAAGGSMSQLVPVLLLGSFLSKTGGQKICSFVTKPNPKDVAFVKELLEAGKLVPVIDARYPLSQLPAALHHMEDRHAQGKIIITM